MELTPLSGPEESRYVQTLDGRVIDLMPELIKKGYEPLGMATIIHGRLNSDMNSDWNSYFFTGDSSATDSTGAVLLTLDSPVLWELTLEDAPFLVNGAFDVALKTDAKRARMRWNELKADKEHSLYLTPAQVEEAHDKGYVLNDKGVFVPANKVVGRIWEGHGNFPGLAQGQNVRPYAQQVSTATGKSKEVMHTYFMHTYFDHSQPEHPQWRSLVLNSIDFNSFVDGDGNLDDYNGRLAGVVSKPVLTSFGQVSGGGTQEKNRTNNR